LVYWVSSLGMLGEGGDRKKEKSWDKDREGERIIWSCKGEQLSSTQHTYLLNLYLNGITVFVSTQTRNFNGLFQNQLCNKSEAN
jgi:hypothetical protein